MRPAIEGASQLLPRELVDCAEQSEREAFIQRYRDTFFVVFRVEQDGALLMELANKGSGRFSLYPESFEATRTRQLNDTSEVPAKNAFGAAEMNAFLARGPNFFVAPVRKRGNESAQRIIIGRSRTSDIVLRDTAISSTHAWIEFDANGKSCITDGRSTNGTWLNGVRVAALEPQPLRAGAELRFAAVKAIVCPVDVFWDTLRLPPK